MTSVEIWKPVPGRPGYEVSNLGRVKSLDRWVNSGKGKRFHVGRILRNNIGNHGYFQAGDLGPVHILMMLAFHGEPLKGYEVAHNDGVRLNNVLSNLRYDTRVGNFADTLKHGTRSRGERNGQSKLTEAEVTAIRSMPGSTRAIARQFNVCQTTIVLIKRHERWGWL